MSTLADIGPFIMDNLRPFSTQATDAFINTKNLKSQKHYVYGVMYDLLFVYWPSYVINTQAYKPEAPASAGKG